jgi:lipopolysaccharide export LptBFGC system permease protein LptF
MKKLSDAYGKYIQIISHLFMILGTVLLFYMIPVEGEPGALPLFLILTGFAGYLINRYLMFIPAKLTPIPGY